MSAKSTGHGGRALGATGAVGAVVGGATGALIASNRWEKFMAQQLQLNGELTTRLSLTKEELDKCERRSTAAESPKAEIDLTTEYTTLKHQIANVTKEAPIAPTADEIKDVVSTLVARINCLCGRMLQANTRLQLNPKCELFKELGKLAATLASRLNVNMVNGDHLKAYYATQILLYPGKFGSISMSVQTLREADQGPSDKTIDP